MPCYFIDTFDHIAVLDDVGHDVPDKAALRTLVRDTLMGMMGAEHKDQSSASFRAEVRDDAGNPVLTGTVLIVISDPPKQTVAATSE